MIATRGYGTVVLLDLRLLPAQVVLKLVLDGRKLSAHGRASWPTPRALFCSAGKGEKWRQLLERGEGMRGRPVENTACTSKGVNTAITRRMMSLASAALR